MSHSFARKVAMVPSLALILGLAAAPILAAGGSELIEIDNLDELRTHFNADQGQVRLVMLLSPTCGTANAGIDWFEREVLTPMPDARFKVYAVWFQVLRGDSKAAWRPSLLDDSRVERFWDAWQESGQWYARQVPLPDKSPLQWDSWFLYGPDAVWPADGAPQEIAWGRTIIDTARRLQEQLLAALGRDDDQKAASR